MPTVIPDLPSHKQLINGESVDYLIVGQGLAGSMLAFELIQRGRRVLVVDNNHHGSSSQVAAGLINPITGHRLNLSDDFIAHLQSAQQLYRALERELGTSFISAIKQQRLIKNPGQANYFSKRCEQADYQPFLAKGQGREFRSDEFGSATIHQTFVVDTKSLLACVRAWLITQNAYYCSKVNYSEIITGNNSFAINGIEASKVIFCEGFQAIYNPWLKDLPFKLAKGEILTLQLDSECTTMLSWGNWLVPQITENQDDHIFAKLGANYAWDDTDLRGSDEVKVKLMNSLQQHTRLQGSITKHEVGVRPTTTLRQAFVGPLSNLDNAYCFNGFGSKGCLTIPHHVHLLSDHLLIGTQLPSEVTQCL